MWKINNPHQDDKVIDACSIFGAMDVSGKVFSGAGVIKAISNMHDRSNGLGGGFAVYGLYPDYAGYYAFHIMYLSENARRQTEAFLKDNFYIVHDEVVPTSPTSGITNPPLFWRYFIDIGKQKPAEISDDDYVVDKVMSINTTIEDVFVFSCGKNMGVFKGVGFPEQIASFFRLDEYEGYLWTAHGRFPTNTPGWWGGAHPFNILDWAVVHNGEISSYGINKRYLEMFGYKCTLLTDTEVMAYLFDLLIRKHVLPLEVACKVIAAPFWKDIDIDDDLEEKELDSTLRMVYSSALVNGPFAVIVGYSRGMLGLNDRIKLRPLVAATRDDVLYVSSEESAIRQICPKPDRVWAPNAGQPVIGQLKGDV
jgi:glutamate synthase domain-containing protein 1